MNIPVHMQERLSTSTDLRPVRPEVAKDKRGLGSARAGICEVGSVTFWEDFEPFGVELDSLCFTPSTNARKSSSEGDGKGPLWDLKKGSEAVGRDKAKKRLWGADRRFY